MTATRTYEYSAFELVLYLAFELSDANWKLGFTTGTGRRPRQRTIRGKSNITRQEPFKSCGISRFFSYDMAIKSCGF
jgi:hypothetical protein